MSTPAGRTDALALAAALVTVVLWASAFVGIRAAGEDLSAGPLALARLLLGGAALGVFVAARREALPPRSDLGLLLVCGLLWFVPTTSCSTRRSSALTPAPPRCSSTSARF